MSSNATYFTSHNCASKKKIFLKDFFKKSILSRTIHRVVSDMPFNLEEPPSQLFPH